MYNVHGFGKRIAAYRRLADLTQEELAARLNITAQAVSKWENEISFPEITILPQLAQELHTTIEKLFGKSEQPSGGPVFPEAKGNLRLVHIFQSVACYSDKEVDVTTADTVVFKDGSHADLRKLEISSQGSGEICFEFADEYNFVTEIDPTRTELEESFTGVKSLHLTVSNSAFAVNRSADNVTRLKAYGTPVFIANLEVKQSGRQLQIVQREQNQIHGLNNRIEIMFGADCGDELAVKITGSGNGRIQIPFGQAQVGISGAGDLDLDSVDQLHCRVSGSGDVNVKKAGKAELAVSGSGDISIDEINGDLFDAQISGAGDITIKSGEVDVFKARISGAGDVNAKGVTARTADLNCKGASDVVLGRVIEESIERHSRMSSIRILQRG